MYTGLSLEQAPPIKVPFLFFVTAPLGGMLASAIIFFGDPVALSSRWSREWFMVSHLMLLGFNTTVMIGAVFQMLPVLAGVVIRQPVVLSRTISYTYAAGLIGLIAGFVFERWIVVLPLIAGLFFALFLFLTVILKALLKARAQHDTVLAMKAALLFLLATVCLALILVAGRLQWLPLIRPIFTDAHLVSGLLGWMGLLIIGVSFQVIPMFHITPPYPPALRKLLVNLIAAALFCYLAIALSNGIGYKLISKNIFLGITLISFAIFCVATLLLLMRKKRKVSDATLRFWGQALIFGLALVGLWIGLKLLNLHIWKMELFLGINLVYGVIMPIMVGMLLKIVPFLVWFHLQSQLLHLVMSGKAVTIPHMKQIVPEKTVRRLFGLHIASLTVINGGLWLEAIPINWTGCLPMVFFAALMWVVARTWRLYVTIQKPVHAPASTG